MQTLRQQLLAFSQAVETYSDKEGLCVRPNENIGEALDPEDAMKLESEMIDPEELEGEEARTIPGQKIVYHQPSKRWMITTELTFHSESGVRIA